MDLNPMDDVGGSSPQHVNDNGCPKTQDGPRSSWTSSVMRSGVMEVPFGRCPFYYRGWGIYRGSKTLSYMSKDPYALDLPNWLARARGQKGKTPSTTRPGDPGGY